MVQLQVEAGKGITYAIKDKLVSQGVDVSGINASTWNSIMAEVSSENNTRKSNNQQAIYRGGDNLFGSAKSNFVVNAGAINLAETTWNKIVNIVTGKSVEDAQQTNQTQGGNQATSIQADVESGKEVAASSLQTLKNSGATVSNWNNNSCTVSKDGWTATISVTEDGQMSYSGDIEAMANLLYTNLKEAQSVKNQENFYKKLGISMEDTEQRTVVVKVNGKKVPAIEIATKDGKYYYLDNDGKQIIPD